ncbi:S-layer homology domain-containing protein [Brevibacillus fortis]|uniref:S-layer homology domain-containing protein n=1 Tax=Brevibacillus fortis TaxID=2126352 RepID=UPI0038FCACC0
MNRSLFIKSATMLAIMGCNFSSVPAMNEKTGIVTTALAAGPASYLTEEQVIPLMKKIPIDTNGYIVEDIYLDETIAFGQNGAVWTSYWVKEKGGNESLYIDVDAKTGKLVQFTKSTDDQNKEAAVDIISEEEALKKAEAFINTVAPEVQGHISKANEYQVDDSTPPQVMNHVFHFVRVENEIPFLENYLQVIVDSQGEIGTYSRKWYDGELPSPVPAISAEEAGRRWDESVKPALHYVYTGEQIGKYGFPQKKMILAYAYDEKAPVFIDAMTNQPMTILGESISQHSRISIGTSTRTLGKEQKKLTDPDRQGELYAIHLPPTEESKKWLFKRNGGYYISFGWLKQGIPVQNLETGVTVDPVNGEVKGMHIFPAYQPLEMIQVQKARIDEQKAKQVEKGNKELRLTYFMPHSEWRNGTYLVSREPKLVYRMVGDDGVVDADSGKWVSYTAYKQSKIPKDIAVHPHYLELLYAVKDGYFPVTNSKLDPDQPVTRGEFLRILLKAQQSYDFFPDYYEVAGDEQFFTDIDKGHPLYETVQDAIERGLIQKTTSNKQFDPDRNLTNAGANEMIAGLLQGNREKKEALSVAGQPTKILTKADVARLLMELKAYAKSIDKE